MPEVIVEDLAALAATVLRPVFDQFWNAGGWPRSPNYDGDGRWAPP